MRETERWRERERERKKEKERNKQKLPYQLVSTPQISAASINPRLDVSGLKSSSLSFIVKT